jgi:diguanylate cyclase (GGDEF)-like protein
MLNVPGEFTYRELMNMAFTDELTRLPNYRHFKYAIKQLIQKCQSNQTEFALIFMDINKFKSINDTYGHNVGDRVLCQCALRLQQIAAKYDLHVHRKSGDEFLLLVDDVKIILELLKSIRSTFRPMFVVQNIPVYCNLSMGYSIFPKHGETEFELIQIADKHMYSNKLKYMTHS